MIGRRKMRRAWLVAILVVSLVAVAIPVCTACASPSPFAGMASGTASGMAHMPGSGPMAHGMQLLTVAACDMVAMAGQALDKAVPAASPLLLLLAVALALVALVTLCSGVRPLRPAPVCARGSPPTADLSGVRLLI